MNSHNLFWLLLAVHPANGLLRDFALPHYSNALTRATVEIIEKFYMSQTNTLNFYHASLEDDDENLKRNLDTLNEVLHNVDSDVVVQLEGYLDFQISQRKRVYNIVIIDSLESFFNFFRLMSPFYFEYQGFYLIVLTTYSYQQYQTMLEIFGYLWAEYIINVNIIWMTPENDNEAIMYSYFPYTSFFCGKVFPTQINQFRHGEWLHKNSHWFPEKVKNLHGCSLRVATVSSAPFMILKSDESGKLTPDGIDGVLLRVLSQRMNFTVDLEQMDSQGTIYFNGTYTGAIKKVIENEANLTIGYMSSTVIRNLYMKSSYVYYTSNMGEYIERHSS